MSQSAERPVQGGKKGRSQGRSMVDGNNLDCGNTEGIFEAVRCGCVGVDVDVDEVRGNCRFRPTPAVERNAWTFDSAIAHVTHAV